MHLHSVKVLSYIWTLHILLFSESPPVRNSFHRGKKGNGRGSRCLDQCRIESSNYACVVRPL